MLTLDALQIQVDDFSLSADLSVTPGSRVAIVGPSGAGKSTLLNTIAGFLTPVSGRILWDQDDLTEVTPGERPISTIFQDNNLFPHLSVFQNVAIGLRPSLRLSVAETDHVHLALQRVGCKN